MAGKAITQRALADRLGMTARHVRNLVKEGLPKIGEGPSALHPWPEARVWYNEYLEKKAAEKHRPTDLDALRKRKLEVDARLVEMEVARIEGRSIDIDVVEHRLSAICERVAAVLKTVPSKYLSPIQTARTDVEAQAVGEKIRDEALRALQGTGIADEDEVEDVSVA